MPNPLIDTYLKTLPLGGWRYFQTTTSTNDEALAWALEDAPDQALVLADHQTKGRGRGNHQWVTNASAGLAFSLILKPSPAELPFIGRFTALAALALVHTLIKDYHMAAAVKWPNDVLLEGKKAAGVLVETQWQAEKVSALVIGMGVNVSPESIPPQENLRFPATCVESAYGHPIVRWEMLRQVLAEMITLRPQLPQPGFIEIWNEHLAFKGQLVTLRPISGEPQQVRLLRVAEDGRLLVEDAQRERRLIQTGELEITYNTEKG